MHEPALTRRYRELVASNQWQIDEDQLAAIAAFERIAATLDRSPRRAWDFWSKKTPVPGLYLWGSVGRGKTFLMDLFVEFAGPTVAVRKHFHRFMSEIHDALKSLGEQRDPLTVVADRISADARVLCLDEMHVNDIGDAMILARLFERLFENGTVLITTSNVPPDGLYRDGLQRARFLPAIALLNTRCEVLNLGGDRDYRLEVLSTAGTFRVCTDDCHSWAQERFERLASGQIQTTEPIAVLGRDIAVEQRAPGIAWFSFESICQTARSQLDYISLGKRLHTVIISSIPPLTEQDNNAVRRFISLVDEFYDRSVNLLISAEDETHSLYAGERLQFEFERTISRLTEMRSEHYLSAPHRP